MGAVTYGLKNVHYALWNEEQSTFGEWKPIPGAVSLSSDANTNQNDFYADDGIYATLSGANSESGSIEFARLTDEIMVDLVGYTVDEVSGLTYVTTEPKNITVALGYEVSGNEKKQRGVRYAVTFTPPSQSANTMTDTTDPDTVTMDYTAIGREFTISGNKVSILKAHVDEAADSDAYNNFWQKVMVPGVAPTGA